MIFAYLTLFSALCLAVVADWFAIIGIMTIYAAFPMHALIMGIVLALAKIVTTSWVYRNWKFSDWKLKVPLIGFIIALMVATSIGTYGFLTKSHLDQNSGTIDNSAKVERLDQQIAREKSVIADDEKVIAQLDATINSYIGKDRTDKSLAVRKSQAPQRKQLRDDIDVAQKRVDTFSDEKLKLQSEVRKQQLDVGPIRYIAELFYGVENDATRNIEAAVRIFTLLITSTLDPLAVILLVAANHTLLRIRDEKEEKSAKAEYIGSDNGLSDKPIAGLEGDKTTSEEGVSSASVVAEAGSNREVSETLGTAPDLLQDDALSVPVLPETLETINEETTPIEEQSEIRTEKLGLDTTDSETVPIINTEGIITGRPSLLQSEIQTEILNAEEKTILERIGLPERRETVPIIRSPSLTRVGGRNIPLSETVASNNTVSSEILPETRMDVSDIIPHFIPQKIYEEEKHTQIQAQAAGALAISRTEESTPSAQEVETISTQGQEESTQTSPDAELDYVRDSAAFSKKIAKYPTALSWLAEFKRTNNG